MAIESPDAELGVRFRPIDEQLIRYLIKFVVSKNYVCKDIEFEELYGSKKAWELLEDSSDTKYFFTKLKKRDTRFSRTLVGGGSWKGKSKGKPVGANKAGTKRTYNYEENKKNEVNDVSWIMKEYSLDDKVIKLLSNRGVMKHKDVVLCYVRCKVKKSRNHMPTTTVSGNDDDEDGDDTLLPQGPNEFGYGDQFPQQIVKPMHYIESGYVGCDDENMNDMTTQPQWPMDDHQLSQLIVTFPMVQGNGAAMNEGNMNGEFVFPEKLSTYQEEQVQNVEETAGNDYQVDPTNNEECLLDELGDFDKFMGQNQQWLSELLS
ncbi:NAC domain-containing protein 100-like [Solanum pennellii]|uniref:NAC domain-containing protein 100-like n=1 Tax=Solanum pennellii TaxID=28526 RepID=A0ABM1FCM7_SOLPN|nr:NAC domain-containing protein 100-like [Solanum pennellii]